AVDEYQSFGDPALADGLLNLRSDVHERHFARNVHPQVFGVRLHRGCPQSRGRRAESLSRPRAILFQLKITWRCLGFATFNYYKVREDAYVSDQWFQCLKVVCVDHKMFHFSSRLHDLEYQLGQLYFGTHHARW